MTDVEKYFGNKFETVDSDMNCDVMRPAKSDVSAKYETLMCSPRLDHVISTSMVSLHSGRTPGLDGPRTHRLNQHNMQLPILNRQHP